MRKAPIIVFLPAAILLGGCLTTSSDKDSHWMLGDAAALENPPPMKYALEDRIKPDGPHLVTIDTREFSIPGKKPPPAR